MFLVTYSAPVFPSSFQWNKSWGFNQPALAQSGTEESVPVPNAVVANAPAPTAAVASYSTPIAYNWNKYLTFNQPSQTEQRINIEPAQATYSRQAPALNWNYNKFWGVNPAPAVAHQSTTNFEIKPVTFTIPSFQIPVPSINWNFNKNWGSNQGIQSKTNVEEREQIPTPIPIQNPQPTAETFEKTDEVQNVNKPVVVSKRVDFNLSVE